MSSCGQATRVHPSTVPWRRTVPTTSRVRSQRRDAISELHPLLPVPFPWTPSYRLKERLEHIGNVWTFHEFTGKVGESDLAGRFALDLSSPKPFIDADLVSTRLNYKDLVSYDLRVDGIGEELITWRGQAQG